MTPYGPASSLVVMPSTFMVPSTSQKWVTPRHAVCRQDMPIKKTQIPLCSNSYLACTSRRFDRVTDTLSGNCILHILAMAGVCISSHVAPCPCRTPSIGASGHPHSCSMQNKPTRADGDLEDFCDYVQPLMRQNCAITRPALCPVSSSDVNIPLPCLRPMV